MSNTYRKNVPVVGAIASLPLLVLIFAVIAGALITLLGGCATPEPIFLSQQRVVEGVVEADARVEELMQGFTPDPGNSAAVAAHQETRRLFRELFAGILIPARDVLAWMNAGVFDDANLDRIEALVDRVLEKTNAK